MKKLQENALWNLIQAETTVYHGKTVPGPNSEKVKYCF